MKINFTKKQYRDLITMCAIANSVVGILGDEDKEEYGVKSKKMEEIQAYLLQFAEEMGCEDLICNIEGKTFLDDDVYTEIMETIMSDYDERELHTSLANKLAWRDFRQVHSKEELEEMAIANGNYFGTVLYEYEKKYWDEFEKHGVDRLEVKE